MFKQIPILSSSEKTPYTITVPYSKVAANSPVKFTRICNYFKENLKYVAIRNFELINNKVSLKAIKVFFGEYKTLTILPRNYSAFLDENGYLDISGPHFDILKEHICSNYRYAANELILGFLSITGEFKLTPYNSFEIAEVKKLLDVDKREFNYNFNVVIDHNNKQIALRFCIKRPLLKSFSSVQIRKNVDLLLGEDKYKSKDLLGQHCNTTITCERYKGI